jgi:hypothetical protein
MIRRQKKDCMNAKSKHAEAVEPEEESDSLEANIVGIALSGKLAEVAKDAIAAGVARGLPVTFQRGEEIIKRYADGREEVLTTVARSHFKMPAGVEIIGKR